MKLRKQGYSYSYIREMTGVAQGTLSNWLGGLPYRPNEETVKRIGRARAASGQVKSILKSMTYVKAKMMARAEIGKVTNRDLLVYGLGLYMGEGGKTADIVRISNSNPEVIQVAVRWFGLLGVQRGQFAPRIHLYPDTDIPTAIAYWSKVCRIPAGQFQKCNVDNRKNKSKSSTGKLPYGTLHLTVQAGGREDFGVFFFRKLEAMNEEVLRVVQKRV